MSCPLSDEDVINMHYIQTHISKPVMLTFRTTSSCHLGPPTSCSSRFQGCLRYSWKTLCPSIVLNRLNHHFKKGLLELQRCFFLRVLDLNWTVLFDVSSNLVRISEKAGGKNKQTKRSLLRVLKLTISQLPEVSKETKKIFIMNQKTGETKQQTKHSLVRVLKLTITQLQNTLFQEITTKNENR